MKFTHLLTAMCCAMSLVSCGKEKQTDLFDYSDPVDLSAILQAYDWYQHYEGEDKDSILYTKMNLELPEDEFYLFEDTAFVLRVPEYANSKQPFLANAEDFYNSCALSWNVWSNYEVMRSRIASKQSASISSRTRMCVRQHRISRTPSSNS